MLTLLFLYIGSFWNSALAHQQQLAITSIEYNPRTEKLEIMHRFALHDAEHAVGEIFKKHADIISSTETQSEFAQYVVERFGLYMPDNQALLLELVGYEIEGKYFWVYQQTDKPNQLDGLQVVHNALRDIWLAQTNTVNIKIGEFKDTLTFDENVEVLRVNAAK